jgi:glutathione S-transferase
MTATLVTMPPSHFCEKARWSLEAAGVPFHEEAHVPGWHLFVVRRLGGRGSVPVLVLDGGRVLDDSPDIVQYADAEAPAAKKLFPFGGRARDEALALERHLDVEFAPHVRRFAYFHLLPHGERAIGLFREGTSPREFAVAQAVFPALRALMKRRMRIDEGGMQRSREKMLRVLDEIGERLRDGRPYLLGDRFGALDITFASFAAPLCRPPEHPKMKGTALVDGPLGDAIRAVRQHPAGEFALRMYREKRAS